jgi:23S rRNA (pseudouridine1915-N3)-methyltransferase
MKIALLAIGKTNESYLQEGIKIFINRLQHYTSFEFIIAKDAKPTKDSKSLKQAEAEILLCHILKDDFIILMDEHGKEFSSIQFAQFIENHQLQSTKRLVFVIGGAFGFDKSIMEKAHFKMSFSNLTFSHQMIRLFFVEQLYRAYTIIRGEKYHNE